jgi:hypothetical protein
MNATANDDFSRWKAKSTQPYMTALSRTVPKTLDKACFIATHKTTFLSRSHQTTGLAGCAWLLLQEAPDTQAAALC